MLDAAAAVAAAVGVIPRVTVVTDDPRADETIVLTAADSLPSVGVVNVTRAAWRIVDGNGIVDNFVSASGLETTVRPTGSGRFTVELTATDSSGASAKVEETIEVSDGGSSNNDDGGNDWGSGALGFGWLAGLLAAVVAAGRAARRGGREGRSSES
jgi:serine protease